MQPNCVFLVFPTALFQKPFPTAIAGRVGMVLVLEEPALIYDARWRPLRVNKNKIAFIRAACREYHDFLTRRYPGLSITYVPYANVPLLHRQLGKKAWEATEFHAWETYDNTLREKYSLCTFHESPMFVLGLEEVRALDIVRQDKLYRHVKAKLGVLQDVPSTDELNREPFRGSEPAPPAPVALRSKHYDDAIRFAGTFSSSHVGNPAHVRTVPVTHAAAQRHLHAFLAGSLKHFGAYQDLVAQRSHLMFHSNVSQLLNVGLLEPLQVVQAAMQMLDRVPINSLEGFVRQVLGWREYTHFLYERYPEQARKVFGAQPCGTCLNARAWRTGIAALDAEIAKAKETGYAHHIVRLMWFLNYMRLAEVPPCAIYGWFMEVVSNDAYEWVMHGNLLAMGYFKEASVSFMYKPYICSSNYLRLMSDYDVKSDELDAMFYHYILKNRRRLEGGGQVYLRNLSYFRKLPAARRQEMLRLARQRIAATKKALTRRKTRR